MRKFGFILALIAIVSSAFGCGEFDLHNQIDFDAGSFSLAWEATGTEIVFEIKTSIRDPLGYFAIGFGTAMKNTDMVIGSLGSEAGDIHLADYYSTGHLPPQLDTTLEGGHNDVEIICATRIEGGSTTFRFKRLLNTGDKYDAVLSLDGETDIVYAWAYNQKPGSLSYHGASNHAHVRVQLSNPTGQSCSSDFGKDQCGVNARGLVSSVGVGSLSTLQTDGAGLSGTPLMFPYVSVCSYADDGNGVPIVLLSHLERSVINAQGDSWHASLSINAPQGSIDFSEQEPMASPRVTILGTLQVIEHGSDAWHVARDVYVKAHPQAEMWISFADFDLYRLDVEHVYYVGGFGGEHYIGWVHVDSYLKNSQQLQMM